MARPSGTLEVGGILEPGTALLHPLPPAPGVPAVGPEKFSKLSRCRPRPTRDRGKVVSSHLEAAGRRWRGVPPAAGARAACSRKRRGGCGARSLARSLAQAQSRSCRQPGRQGSGERSRGCRREETGGGGRRRGSRGRWRAAGCGWVEGPQGGLGSAAFPSLASAPATPPLSWASQSRGPRGSASGVFRNAGKDAYGSGRVRVLGEQGRCAGATAGTEKTSLLRTAGLGPSPGG